MRRNKIGAMFLVSVLALAGVGISYAGFTDEIHIYGTVDTATVDIELTGWYSGTFVWKIWNPVDEIIGYPGLTIDMANEIAIYRGFYDENTKANIEAFLDGFCEYEFQSESYAAYSDSDDFDVKMAYMNLFPCIDFEADFIIHYVGSIPAKIDTAEIFSDDAWLQALWAMHKADPDAGFGAWVEAYRCYGYDANDERTDVLANIVEWDIHENEPVGIGYQLHYCNYTYVKLVIHLPQDNLLQGLSGEFGGKIGVIQWNDQCDDTTTPGKTITIPETALATFTHPGANSYFDVTLRNIDPSGTYSPPIGSNDPVGPLTGWCVDQYDGIESGEREVELYSSLAYESIGFPWDGNGQHAGDLDWPCVNYIINHRIGYSKDTIQASIWYFINGGHDPSDMTLVNAAIANVVNGNWYDNFPRTGEFVAVLLDSGDDIQHTIIEIDP